VLRQQQSNIPPVEEDNPRESDLTMIRWSRHLNVGNEARGQGLVEVEAAEMDVEAMAKLLKTLAELTSTPLLEL
jgi:hypothetical protein